MYNGYVYIFHILLDVCLIMTYIGVLRPLSHRIILMRPLGWFEFETPGLNHFRYDIKIMLTGTFYMISVRRSRRERYDISKNTNYA